MSSESQVNPTSNKAKSILKGSQVKISTKTSRTRSIISTPDPGPNDSKPQREKYLLINSPSSQYSHRKPELNPCADHQMGVKQNPWRPTVRRGPIAAETASPGPAVVSLPSLIGKPPPESRKPRAPAFTFGQKLHDKSVQLAGPGPAGYNTEGMTSKGRVTAPAASLHRRWPQPRVESTPAPCDYEMNKAAKIALEKAPAFTIGMRVSVPEPGAKTPAPNMYSVPPVLGEAKEGSKKAAPAFSICGKPKDISSKAQIPGPGAYTTDKGIAAITKKPPAFTMAPRREPKDMSPIPGPGVYCPEKVIVNAPWTPAHTFGIRHSEYLGKPNHYPAPSGISVI